MPKIAQQLKALGVMVMKYCGGKICIMAGVLILAEEERGRKAATGREGAGIGQRKGAGVRGINGKSQFATDSRHGVTVIEISHELDRTETAQ